VEDRGYVSAKNNIILPYPEIHSTAFQLAQGVIDGIGGEGLIGNPGEVLLFLGADLPVFHKVDAKLGMAAVERQVMDSAKAMGDARVLRIDVF
jgi:hypothetical protein